MLSTIGRRAVREARSAALRVELINSQRLKAHFEDNPRELLLLKHNAPAASAEARAHLTFLPRYLVRARARARNDRDTTHRASSQLPEAADEKAINANAIRSQAPVLTSTELKQQKYNRKKLKRKSNGNPVKGVRVFWRAISLRIKTVSHTQRRRPDARRFERMGYETKQSQRQR